MVFSWDGELLWLAHLPLLGNHIYTETSLFEADNRLLQLYMFMMNEVVISTGSIAVLASCLTLVTCNTILLSWHFDTYANNSMRIECPVFLKYGLF